MKPRTDAELAALLAEEEKLERELAVQSVVTARGENRLEGERRVIPELVLTAAVLTQSTHYLVKLLEPSTQPATIGECERAGARGTVATLSYQLRGTRVWHRRWCIYLREESL